jgi:murein DD-endopeptidase MepM/ murein hydrolase activator NlpD
MKKKSLIPSLLLIMLILAPGTGYANPGQLIADAPTGAQPETALRPVYLQQLLGLRDKTAESKEPTTLEHRVGRGETLGAIAREYGTSVRYLMSINNLSNPHFIREGQILTLLVDHPTEIVAQVTHTLKRGETVWDLSRRYYVSMDAILTENKIADPHRLVPGQQLLIPGSKAAAVAVQPKREIVVASRSGERVDGNFIWPAPGYISSGYGPRWGRFHYGVDIANKTGTPIVAIADGTVTNAGWQRGYGYMVRIDHNNGWVSLYGHASRLYVSEGQDVRSGQRIAAIGQTGNATGPHVHLETILNGKHQNPLRHLPSR